MPLKVWNGSSWTTAAGVKVWNGSSWVSAQAGKIWDGAAWKDFLTKIYLNGPSIYINSTWPGFPQASAVYSLNADGFVYHGNYTTTQTFYKQEQWCTPATDVSNYEALVTLYGPLSFGTTGSWVNLGTTQYWSLTVGSMQTNQTDFTIQIRRVGTTDILATTSVNLFVDTTTG